MIRSIRHKGLRQFHEKGQARGIDPNRVKRIRAILARLESSSGPQDMNLPGFGFHPLKGNRKDVYAVEVSGNWRITFRYGPDGAYDLNLEDYH